MTASAVILLFNSQFTGLEASHLVISILGGANIYLRIKGVDEGNQCMSGFKLPGDSSFKTELSIDLRKLLNIPYGGSSKYWIKFGGYGVAASTPFTGCIDDNNQEYVAVTGDKTGILKFSEIQVNLHYHSIIITYKDQILLVYCQFSISFDMLESIVLYTFTFVLCS